MKKFICAELLLLFMLIIPQNISASNWVNTHLLDQKGNAIYVDESSIHKVECNLCYAWFKLTFNEHPLLLLIYFNTGGSLAPQPKYSIEATVAYDKDGKILFQKYAPPTLFPEWKNIQDHSGAKKLFDYIMSRLDSKKD